MTKITKESIRAKVAAHEAKKTAAVEKYQKGLENLQLTKNMMTALLTSTRRGTCHSAPSDEIPTDVSDAEFNEVVLGTILQKVLNIPYQKIIEDCVAVRADKEQLANIVNSYAIVAKEVIWNQECPELSDEE